jgi:hypothetical protein
MALTPLPAATWHIDGFAADGDACHVFRNQIVDPITAPVHH